jgi:membrane-bound ClpP family serine protease
MAENIIKILLLVIFIGIIVIGINIKSLILILLGFSGIGLLGSLSVLE